MTRKQTPTHEQRQASIAAEIAQINLELERLRVAVQSVPDTRTPSVAYQHTRTTGNPRPVKLKHL